jgi:hypothetical protein
MADSDRKNEGPKRDLARLLLGLARGQSARAAAKVAGFSERTARRLAAGEFMQREVAILRESLMRQALAQLVGSQTAAVRTLRRLLRARSEQVQLGAARALLEQVREHRAYQRLS